MGKRLFNPHFPDEGHFKWREEIIGPTSHSQLMVRNQGLNQSHLAEESMVLATSLLPSSNHLCRLALK